MVKIRKIRRKTKLKKIQEKLNETDKTLEKLHRRWKNLENLTIVSLLGSAHAFVVLYERQIEFIAESCKLDLPPIYDTFYTMHVGIKQCRQHGSACLCPAPFSREFFSIAFFSIFFIFGKCSKLRKMFRSK